MLPALIIYTIGDLICSLLNIYTVGVLGDFADAVFKFDFKAGIHNFYIVLICLFITIFIVPGINVCGEIIMFSNSLQHDRRCLSKFLNKTYENAMSMDAGEVQARLEQDPIELRCNWVDIIEKLIVIPITLAYLIYKSLKINIIFTIVLFGILSLRLSVPYFTKRIHAKFDIQNRQYYSSVRSKEIKMCEKPHVVKLFRLNMGMIKKLDHLYGSYYENVGRKNIIFNTVVNSIDTWLDPFCHLIILFSGAILVSAGSITAGSVAMMLGCFSIYNTVFL